MNEPRAQQAVAPTASATLNPPSGERQFAPGDPFISFAAATLANEVTSLLAVRPAANHTPTPDEIHQLRVAARRLRVALRLFRRMLPSREVARFRADLRWFASSLGDARDLDVYAKSFKAYRLGLPAEQQSELSGYELYLRRERADARQRATASFDHPRTTALFDDIARFAAAAPSTGALRRWRSLSVRDGVRLSIRQSAARVRRLGNRLDPRSRPTEIHELRIKAKRLRYELEFFAAVYPALELPAKTCKTLQELLGAHQDAYTATARLRRYANLLKKQESAAGALPAALTRLRRSHLEIARNVRLSFSQQWPGFVLLMGDLRHAVA